MYNSSHPPPPPALQHLYWPQTMVCLTSHSNVLSSGPSTCLLLGSHKYTPVPCMQASHKFTAHHGIPSLSARWEKEMLWEKRCVKDVWWVWPSMWSMSTWSDLSITAKTGIALAVGLCHLWHRHWHCTNTFDVRLTAADSTILSCDTDIYGHTTLTLCRADSWVDVSIWDVTGGNDVLHISHLYTTGDLLACDMTLMLC